MKTNNYSLQALIPNFYLLLLKHFAVQADLYRSTQTDALIYEVPSAINIQIFRINISHITK